MGLYDHIRCKHPLPDGFTGDIEYQTKDTDEQYLGHYTIREDGVLVHHTWTCRTIPPEDRDYLGLPLFERVPKADVEVPFHGALEFYASNGSAVGSNGYMTEDGKRRWWRCYTALYDHGRLLKIEGGIEYDTEEPVSREEFWRDDKPTTGATP